MPQLDLDFRERRCTLSIFILTTLLLIVSSASVYSYYSQKSTLNRIKTEAMLIYNTPITPVAFLKDSIKSAMVIKIGTKTEVIKSGDNINKHGVSVKIYFSDSTVLLKGENFSRVIKW